MSSEEVKKRKELLVEVLNDLVKNKRPPRGTAPIEHLKTIILDKDVIRFSTLIVYLACAGYTIEDMLYFVERAGLVPSGYDLAKLKDLIVRALFSKRSALGGLEEGGGFEEIEECLPGDMTSGRE